MKGGCELSHRPLRLLPVPASRGLDGGAPARLAVETGPQFPQRYRGVSPALPASGGIREARPEGAAGLGALARPWLRAGGRGQDRDRGGGRREGRGARASVRVREDVVRGAIRQPWLQTLDRNTPQTQKVLLQWGPWGGLVATETLGSSQNPARQAL